MKSSSSGFSVYSKFSKKVLGFDSLVFMDREGRTSFGPGLPCHLAIEVSNVGGWLTHGDLALKATWIFWRLLSMG